MNTFLLARLMGRIVFEAANEGKPGADAAAIAAAAATAAAEAKATADAATAAAEAEAAAAAVTAAAEAAAEAAKTPAEKAKAKAEADLLREVMDKKQKLAATNEALTAANSALAAYNGVDPVKVKALLAKEAAAEEAAALAAGDFERVKTMMAEAHKTEKAALEAELATEKEARTSDRNLINELTIGNSFGMSTFIKDQMILSPEKVRTLYGAHFEMKDGRMVAYNKATGADRAVLVNASGDPLSFEAAIEKIVQADPDKATVLRAKAKPGAGSNTADASAAATAAAAAATTEKAGVFGRSRLALALNATTE